jgi:hypothetical protein
MGCMTAVTDDAPNRPQLVLARELSRFRYDDPEARHAAAKGRLLRIRRGIYVRPEEWGALSPQEKYATVCRGYSACRGEAAVLSHESAAAIWGLPQFGPPPRVIHVASDERRMGRGSRGVRVHTLRLAPEDVVWHEGVLVTSLARTVLDLAASAEVYTAVSAIDHVLHVDRFGRARTGLTRDDLRDAYDDALPIVGSVRAAARIKFGETGAATAAESASRVTMALIGAPPPELQRRYVCESGDYDVDFYLEEADAIGEVDGKQKYLDAAYRGGRTAEQTVYAEKVREDELRAECRAFGRWPAEVGSDPARLRIRMLKLGVRVGLRRPRLG